MLEIDDVLDSLKTGSPLVFAKINHGFWESCLVAKKLQQEHGDWSARRIDEHLKRQQFVEGGMEELLEILNK